MAKVLTESEVAAIGGTSTSYGNRCCTKARAEELGCTVTEPSGAANNQLITGVTPNTATITFKVESPIGAMYNCSIRVSEGGSERTISNINANSTVTLPYSWTILRFLDENTRFIIRGSQVKYIGNTLITASYTWCSADPAGREYIGKTITGTGDATITFTSPTMTTSSNYIIDVEKT